MTGREHWANVLTLRDEVTSADGSVGELQMSLSKAVYQTVPVPYAKVAYFTDITQPTPLLVGFLGRVARRLGVHGLDAQACFHLDQGMGGGKSHALVGLWHLINTTDEFFASELGAAVQREAQAGGHAIDLSGVIPVVLTCDGFSPGRKDPRFGPATDLYGRFLWLLFDGHADRMGRWQHYTALGSNKTALQQAFAEVGRPVLVLIDELMDYVMALTDESTIGRMPGEKAFLNALTDAVDDQPNVALVLVMIRSDEDQAGYHPEAEALRDYLTPRLQRNGETVTVTEPADFAQIIRRRLFKLTDITGAAGALGDAYAAAAGDGAWGKSVFPALGTGRTPATLPDRIADTYPFHPDLFSLVSREWTVVQAFQRVRSTVQIFARTALHWVTEHQAGRWAPDLIGVGDIPLHTPALEAVLSSGVLAGNDRAIQGYRAVATNDIIRTGGGDGTAWRVDERLRTAGVDASQPHPAVRMASACFAYSLVARAGGNVRGASKAEMLAAVFAPDVAYTGAEEVFNALTSSPTDGGLGALERTRSSGRNGGDRYYLSIKQTLTMYHANATGTVSADQALDHVWTRAQHIASKGAFGRLITLAQPATPGTPGIKAFEGLDAQETRLVVLDPRRWTLMNGKDAATRADLGVAFGINPGLVSNYAASMVVAVVTTQRRERAKAMAKDYLAWALVTHQLNPEDEEYPTAVQEMETAGKKLDDAVRWAYQHFAYLLAGLHSVEVRYTEVPEGHTSLSGDHVWNALIAAQRATKPNTLSGEYVAQLIAAGQFGRDLTLKEVFALPYTNPAWTLIGNPDELRKALFDLSHSDGWMIVNSDGTEARPTSPQQIQSGSMQQTITRRPEPEPEPEPEPIDVPDNRPTLPRPGGGTTTTPGSEYVPPRGGESSDDEPVYDRTTIALGDTSITDQTRREQVWQLVAQIASLLDPAKASSADLQMVNLNVTITARRGDTANLVNKANQVQNVRTRVEEDEF